MDPSHFNLICRRSDASYNSSPLFCCPTIKNAADSFGMSLRRSLSDPSGLPHLRGKRQGLGCELHPGGPQSAGQRIAGRANIRPCAAVKGHFSPLYNLQSQAASQGGSNPLPPVCRQHIHPDLPHGGTICRAAGQPHQFAFCKRPHSQPVQMWTLTAQRVPPRGLIIVLKVGGFQRRSSYAQEEGVSFSTSGRKYSAIKQIPCPCRLSPLSNSSIQGVSKQCSVGYREI